ncbi:MAG TPA: hypothetical protein PK317_04775 [Coprothermobacter proteolyticus]|nr:hypothetical protein [Coprothermobacter proteolyticus]
MSNTSEQLIDTITKWFDDNNDLHLVESLDKVYDVYVQVEEFVESLGLTPEHEVSESEFEDLPVTDLSNEDQLNEVKFVLPLMLGEEPHELVLEFSYQRVEENEYAIWVDCDFFLEDEEYE